MDSVITWPELCGNRSQYDVFWDPKLTLETFHPVLTDCFQKTVLVWVPCGWLWLASLFYVPALYRKETVHGACSISKANLWKMALGSTIVLMSVLDFSRTLTQGLSTDLDPPPLADYIGGATMLGSLLLALFLTRYSYVKGQHTSGVLFMFWLFLVLAGMLQLISVTSSGYNMEVQPDDFDRITLYIYFGLVVLMLLSNVFSDRMATTPFQQDSWERKSDEKTPLITKPATQDVSKNPNPYDNASFLSRTFFSWFMPVVYRGYKKSITYSDIWDVRKEDASKTIVDKLQVEWDKELAKSERTGSQPSLLKALVKAFWMKQVYAGLILFTFQGTQLLNPTIMNAVIGFVQSDNEYLWQGYLLATCMFLCSTFGSIMMQQSSFRSYHTGMHLKSAIITAVYRKALRISNTSRKSVTTGEIVNLMSVDAQKVQNSQLFIHWLWIAPFSVGFTMVLLYQKLGPTCFVGLAFLIVVIPVNSLLIGAMIGKYQKMQMKYKDARIKLMNQILTGIKVLKLYAWEPYFIQKIEQIRTEELRVLRKAAVVNSINYVLSFSSQFLVALLCFMTYVLSSPDHVLTPDITFVSISLFAVLGAPLVIVPSGVMTLIQGAVSVARIQKFLLQPELNPNNVQHDFSKDGTIVMKNGTFSWGEADRIPLKSINLCVPEGSLVAVVGAVGSGKSSLIQAMLGEMDVIEGSVNVKGSVAYVPQQAWIQNLTVRDNILFDKPYQRQKYDMVLDGCALVPDLSILTGGDMTEIGERGINLSGGQKQRVSLARAVYQNADIYLLDDPLSAVDSHVGKHLFERIIGPGGLLEHKTRILVTNALTYLTKVNRIVVLKEGTISEMGTYDELLDRNGAFAELIKHYLTEIEEREEESDPETEKLTKELRRRISSMSQSSTDGNVSEGQEIRKRKPKRSISKKISVIEKEEKTKKKDVLITEEGVEEGSVKLSVISSYVSAAGLKWTLLVMLALLMNVGGTVGTNVWLSFWSNDGAGVVNGTQPVGVGLRLGVYGALGMVQTSGIFLLSLSVAFGCIKAAQTLHYKLLNNNLRSPMAFFDTTPVGRILNRFSKDVDTVDAELQMYIQNWLGTVGGIISIITIIMYSTPIFVVVIVPLIILFIILQRVYVATARQLKRVDSIKRSPIYSNFSETLNGVSSIRAYRHQGRFIEHADRLLDNSQRVWFPVFASNRWICVWAELLGDSIIFFAAIFCILQKDTLDGGTVGLSLSFALQISFQVVIGLRCSCELETYIVAVERIKEYSETETEAPWELAHRPSSNWPDKGVIEFRDYKTRYRQGLDLVLKNIVCQTEPGEKVGIVGRTGAGKSSMTLALFRIIEAVEGSIMIDGERIQDMGLHDLRSKLTIIPQDPVLFSGSLRFNVDPADQYSDAEVWTALEQAHLKEFVAGLPDTLMYESGEDGQNFSVGQRQLVCLARALLRKTKILVMDEATAAVDLETDDLIQTTIRTEFKGCTVLTIAHRLNTIMDYDRIMVLDAGVVKEFDQPQTLLKQTSSIFHGMAADAGLI